MLFTDGGEEKAEEILEKLNKNREVRLQLIRSEAVFLFSNIHL